MTDQEIFDTVVAHLRAQGEPGSDTETDECCYRGFGRAGQTVKCAVGCLIPDEFYRESLESWAFDHGEVRVALDRALGEGWNGKLLQSLQIAHDDSAAEFYWESAIEKGLAEVAQDHGLVYAPR